eukprot:scaffold122038_cov20-Tisochrysis_lutea.AAC.1
MELRRAALRHSSRWSRSGVKKANLEPLLVMQNASHLPSLVLVILVRAVRFSLFKLGATARCHPITNC